jgi:hypothetical protein
MLCPGTGEGMNEVLNLLEPETTIESQEKMDKDRIKSNQGINAKLGKTAHHFKAFFQGRCYR